MQWSAQQLGAKYIWCHSGMGGGFASRLPAGFGLIVAPDIVGAIDIAGHGDTFLFSYNLRTWEVEAE